jgi:hypothetical protein
MIANAAGGDEMLDEVNRCQDDDVTHIDFLDRSIPSVSFIKARSPYQTCRTRVAGMEHLVAVFVGDRSVPYIRPLLEMHDGSR